MARCMSARGGVRAQRAALWGMPVGLVVAGLFAGYGISHRAHPVSRGVVPAALAAASPLSGPAPDAAGRSRAGAAPAAAAPPSAVVQGSLPLTLSIPQLHVRAPVVPVVVEAGDALGVPADPGTIGWWAGGALPGSAAGSVVFDGHVDSASAGAGALFDLRAVQVGDVVTVSGNPAAVSYRITGVREYDKATLPAASLFVRAGSPRLVLITCGGPFDRVTRHYRDNIVAFGTPIGPAAAG